jgi:hypothetical protein
VSAQHGHSTLPKVGPPGKLKRPRLERRVPIPSPTIRSPKSLVAPRNQVGRIISDEEGSLLDLIDNLLSKGVMLNADLILALADVDLIYIRLSALLCAADRVLPRLGPGTARATSGGQGYGGQAPGRN